MAGGEGQVVHAYTIRDWVKSHQQRGHISGSCPNAKRSGVRTLSLVVWDIHSDIGAGRESRDGWHRNRRSKGTKIKYLMFAYPFPTYLGLLRRNLIFLRVSEITLKVSRPCEFILELYARKLRSLAMIDGSPLKELFWKEP